MQPRRFPSLWWAPGDDPVEAGLIESLARPGVNITGLTNLDGKLGGKRLELLKEAVPKVARVAIIYQPATPANIVEVKEDLPSAALALKVGCPSLGGTSCERFRADIRRAKQGASGWTLRRGGRRFLNANQNRIVAFALKSRLPSTYDSREAVKSRWPHVLRSGPPGTATGA